MFRRNLHRTSRWRYNGCNWLSYVILAGNIQSNPTIVQSSGQNSFTMAWKHAGVTSCQHTHVHIHMHVHRWIQIVHESVQTHTHIHTILHKWLLRLFVSSVFFFHFLLHLLRAPKGKNGHWTSWVILGQGRRSTCCTAWIRAVSSGSGLGLAWVGLLECGQAEHTHTYTHAQTNIHPLFFTRLINQSPTPYVMNTKSNKILYIKVYTHIFLTIVISSSGDVTLQSNTKNV